MSILYISYDGLLEPLGQSQVFQYLRNLSAHHKIVLVTYEKPSDWNNLELRKRLQEESKKAKIRWVPLTYHCKPPVLSTFFDLTVGFLVCAFLSLRHKTSIIHVRGYTPAVIGLGLKLTLRKRFIFDMRGFWADEKVDAQVWLSNSLIYSIAKWFESKFLIHADVVVSLTNAAVAIMKKFPYLKSRPTRFDVIPTCTNLDLFHPIKLDPENDKTNHPSFLLGHVGSVTWSLFDEVLNYFKVLREARLDAKLLVLNNGSHAYIKDRLIANNISDNAADVREADYSQMPNELSKLDAGIFFYKPTFSKKATAPTKLGEFLACGIPCLTLVGVGDTEEIIENENVGVVLRDLTSESQEEALYKLLKLKEDPQTKTRCIQVAKKYFSLEKGVEAYDRIYRSLE
jgi:glycosyltransferase involved in cell wall biosynthesis